MHVLSLQVRHLVTFPYFIVLIIAVQHGAEQKLPRGYASHRHFSHFSQILHFCEK
jgi:hypothetical protein